MVSVIVPDTHYGIDTTTTTGQFHPEWYEGTIKPELQMDRME